MAKFLYGTELSICIEKMILNANEYLFLISPYIKLHGRIKDELKKKKINDKLEIIIVFGKNEEDKSKSLCNDDLIFLKDFPNIKICYEKNLHAKYYASETSSLITSMNLHQFSQNTNVEVGVEMFPKSFVRSLADKIKPVSDCDGDSIDYFETVIKNSEKLFIKTPQYQTGVFKDKYLNSVVEVDHLEEFFNQKKTGFNSARTSSNNNYTKSSDTSIQDNEVFKPGFCIRRGTKITFNPGRPLCAEAFKMWSKYNDLSYHEAYCHFSGEPSLGETSYGKPILRKNLRIANELLRNQIM